MGEANSPYFRIGQIHGAFDAARPARMRTGYHQPYAHSWLYRRGFAWGFLSHHYGGSIRPVGIDEHRPRARRPPISELTAATIRKAHAQAAKLRRMGRPLPAGIALLESDYAAWRRRVAAGIQPDTLTERTTSR